MLLLKGKDCQSRCNLCFPQETHSKYKETKRLEVKREKKYHANIRNTKISVATLILDEKDFNTKCFLPNYRASKYLQQFNC